MHTIQYILLVSASVSVSSPLSLLLLLLVKLIFSIMLFLNLFIIFIFWPPIFQYNHGKRFEIDGYATDYFAEEASKAIIANKNRPFFLFFSPSAIHSPLQALKDDYDKLAHIDNHCDRVYAAMIVAADRAVGKVLATLKEQGLEDNTLVILTSDNGAPNMVSRAHVNDPYRGWKATFFEGMRILNWY
jgi:arylsulfatase A-like enzyme